MDAIKKQGTHPGELGGWSARDFWVGEYLVKPLEGLLEPSHGGHLRLEPKTIGVLSCLASRQGRTVTKRELLDQVWPDTTVTEHVLTRCVSQLRRAMRDNGERQAVIRTVYKRGYRLLAPVSFQIRSEPTAAPVDATPGDPESLADRLGYRQILASTRDHIYLYDRRCRYLFANPSGARAVGLGPEDMVGKHWRELGLVAEILEPFEAHVHQCFDRGESFLERVSYPTVYGERFYEYSLDPVRDPDDQIVAVLAVVRDITGRCQEWPFLGQGPRGKGQGSESKVQSLKSRV